MNRFLFLKTDWADRSETQRRGVSNAGIDPRLLHLLTARYV